MPPKVKIDRLLYNILLEQDLVDFVAVLVNNSLTKVDHFSDVSEAELIQFGLPAPGARRLRKALEEKDLKKAVAKRIKKKQPVEYIDVEVKSKSPVPEEPALVPQPSISLAPVPAPAPTTVAPTPAPNGNSNGGSTTIYNILKSDITLSGTLGEGTFAIVKRGLWTKSENETLDVAVKVLREVSPVFLNDLQEEINVMSRLRHPSLIMLYGIVFDNPIKLVMEFCEDGALINRLRSQDKPQLLATQMLSFSVQIAAGMAYLQQMGYIHRDLAARNVLLKDSERQVKICDFGMSRLVSANDGLYNMDGAKKVPFAWCPPEALRYKKFSSASDVWSFGVLLWELWSFGEEPWIGRNALEVLLATEKGERLRQPEKAPSLMYDVMNTCWTLWAQKRPSFSDLQRRLEAVRFGSLEASQSHKPSIPAEVAIERGVVFTVLEEVTPTTLLGQNTSTREFGYLPKSILRAVAPAPLPPPVTTMPSYPTLSPSNMAHPAPNRTITTTLGPVIAAPVPHHHQSNGRPTQHQQLHQPTRLSTNGYKAPAPAKPTTAPVSSNGNGNVIMRRTEISRPIPHSLIHVGHGDSDRNLTWGDVGKIPDVYLKNPVQNPVVGTNPVSAGINLSSTPASVPLVPSLPAKGPVVNQKDITNELNSRISAGVVLRNQQQIPHSSRSQSSIASAPANWPSTSNTLKASWTSSVPPPVPVSIAVSRTPPPTMPSHQAANDRARKPLSINEQIKAVHAFNWVEDLVKEARKNDSPTSQTAISAAKKFDPSTSIPRPDRRTVCVDNGMLAKLEALKPPSTMQNGFTNGVRMLPQPASQSAVSSLTLANTELPMMNTGGRDPFIVPPEARELATKPLYNDFFTTKHNGTQHPSATATMPTRQAAQIASELRNHFASSAPLKMTSTATAANSTPAPTTNTTMNGLATNRPIPPTLDDILASSSTSTSSASAPKPSVASGLPPPSSLMQELSATAPHLAPATTPTQMPVKSMPRPPAPAAIPILPLQRLPMNGTVPRVIPGTAQSSANAHDSFISDQQLTKCMPMSPVTPTSSTNFLPYPTTTTTTATMMMPGPPAAMPSSAKRVQQRPQPANDLDVEVARLASLVSFASLSDCRAALARVNGDVERAARQLKVRQLQTMGLASDSEVAHSALDVCNWDINRAADRLLAA